MNLKVTVVAEDTVKKKCGLEQICQLLGPSGCYVIAKRTR